MTLYHQMIGSLMYLTASRPDIMFSICYCARFQANPYKPRMIAVKNIFRYLKRASSLGIWYQCSLGFFVPTFSDADLKGCGLDCKSTTGYKTESGRNLYQPGGLYEDLTCEVWNRGRFEGEGSNGIRN